VTSNAPILTFVPAAYLLPFGSGSAPAAKGVITEMIPESQRTDALSAITLVENMARLSTVGLFGFIFSAFAEIGKAYLSFFCNAVRRCCARGRTVLKWRADMSSTGNRNYGDDHTFIFALSAAWKRGCRGNGRDR
jgi:hypothetical protein